MWQRRPPHWALCTDCHDRPDVGVYRQIFGIVNEVTTSVDAWAFATFRKNGDQWEESGEIHGFAYLEMFVV